MLLTLALPRDKIDAQKPEEHRASQARSMGRTGYENVMEGQAT